MVDQGVYRRVLLDPDVTEEQLEELALDLNWLPLGFRAATDTAPYQHVWQDEVADVYIHFVWDDLLRQPYLLLRGDDVSAIERQIRDRLPTYTYDEVVDQLRSASGREQVIDALCQIALLRYGEGMDMPEDPEIVRLLRREASNDDADVRRAVITSVSYLEWPSLLALVAELRDRDPDAAVRDDAAMTLEAIAESRANDVDNDREINEQ